MRLLERVVAFYILKMHKIGGVGLYSIIDYDKNLTIQW